MHWIVKGYTYAREEKCTSQISCSLDQPKHQELHHVLESLGQHKFYTIQFNCKWLVVYWCTWKPSWQLPGKFIAQSITFPLAPYTIMLLTIVSQWYPLYMEFCSTVSDVHSDCKATPSKKPITSWAMGSWDCIILANSSFFSSLGNSTFACSWFLSLLCTMCKSFLMVAEQIDEVDQKITHRCLIFILYFQWRTGAFQAQHGVTKLVVARSM